MPNLPFALAACALTLVLAGCSQRGTSELLNDAPSVQTARANPDLTMPPDLRLPQPGSGPVASEPAAPAARPAKAASVNPITGAAAGQPQGDIYEQYGISKVRADGTPKTADELREELRKAILAKKREQNPDYGTFKNLGNIFSNG